MNARDLATLDAIAKAHPGAAPIIGALREHMTRIAKMEGRIADLEARFAGVEDETAGVANAAGIALDRTGGC